MTRTLLAILGAIVAISLGRWIELYQFGDPQVWIAAVIGGALASVAYGGPNEESLARAIKIPERSNGALSLSCYPTDLSARSKMSSP